MNRGFIAKIPGKFRSMALMERLTPDRFIKILAPGQEPHTPFPHLR